MKQSKVDYLRHQYECICRCASLASISHNGMLVEFNPRKSNYSAYVDVLRSLSDLESMISRVKGSITDLLSVEADE